MVCGEISMYTIYVYFLVDMIRNVEVIKHKELQQCHKIQYNTTKYNTIQYNTGTIQYNAIQYNTIQSNTGTSQRAICDCRIQPSKRFPRMRYPKYLET